MAFSAGSGISFPNVSASDLLRQAPLATIGRIVPSARSVLQIELGSASSVGYL